MDENLISRLKRLAAWMSWRLPLLYVLVDWYRRARDFQELSVHALSLAEALMSVLKETSWLTIGVLLFSFVCLLFGTSDRWWPPLRELVKEYIPWLGSGMTNRGRRAGYKFPPHEIRELRASVEGCRSALTVPDNGSFAATQEAYRKFDEIRVALIGEPQLDKLMNKFNGLYSRFVGLRRRIEDLPNNPDHWGQHRDREIDRMYGLEDDLGDEIFIAANDLMRETEWILD